MSGPVIPARRNLFENLFSLLAAQAVSKLTTLIALFFLARYLGEAEFGRYAVALAIPMALEALADLGVSQVIIREGAGQPDVLARDMADALPIKVVLALLSIPLAYGIARATGLPAEVAAVSLFFAIGKALDSLTLLARSVFETFERMEYEAASLIFDAVVRLSFTLYALLNGFGLLGLAKALVLSSAVVLVASWIVVRHRFIWALPRPRIGRSGRLLIAGLPFALVWFFETLGLRTQIVLAAELGGDVVAGVLGAAVRTFEAVLVVPSMLAVALLPVASRHATNTATMTPLFVGVGKAALASGIAGGLLLVGLAPVAVPLIFGSGFGGAVVVLQILALALPASFARPMISRFLLAVRSPWALLLTQLGSVAIGVVVGSLAIPRAGAAGAAAAFVAGELAAAIIGLLALRRVSDLGSAQLLRPFLAAAPAAAVLAATISVQPVVAAVAGLVVFVAGVRLTRVFDAAEVGYLGEAVPWLTPLTPLLRPRVANDARQVGNGK